MLEQGLVQFGFLAFFSIVARYGTTAYAAYGIGISLVSFSIVVGFGFGIAAALHQRCAQPPRCAGTGAGVVRQGAGRVHDR